MCGDFTAYGNVDDVDSFRDWYLQQPFKYRVVIAGNHELTFDEVNRDDIIQRYLPYFKVPVETIKSHIYHDGIIYVEHDTIELMGLKIFCSPYTPFFYNWAFPLPDLEGTVWKSIQPQTDIIVTHGPPIGILDTVSRELDGPVPREGDEFLKKKVFEIRPAIHIFGHIHESYGIQVHDSIVFANVSVMNRSYQVVNQPLVFDHIPK
ncbi:metallophosphoesterase domain-containing protein 1 isoform X2 [Histomonas meleagridis]|uniref:metallophosphoesterase domain-containing protein 1 isoform X2 n=1 Tax=Histomonas meleagridis TaxID=135588 RepID=UPI00355AA3BB|nr:metallophosphoesterase domain-containing protein 1 isoform X2 [Histomonas meleagridis]KAH0796446.1 metallophosphoesterase domain-containing protein 1 isoform X2 [Histomonas meleagridis]